MGHIRERELKDGGVRFQAEIRLKGHPTLTASFDRKSDAKHWIQKTESDIRCGRHQLYSQGKRYTFKEVVDRYSHEFKMTTAKLGHLTWWTQELGSRYLQDIRPSIITEKKQKLLNEINSKGKIRTKSTVNRYLATISHLLSVCYKQYELISENPIKKISREKEPRERTRFLSSEERERFLRSCQESDNPLLYTFVVLLLSTGGRYKEILRLKWTDVDLFKGRITFNQTKNGDIRSIPLRGLGLNLLRKLASDSNSIGFIFASNHQSQPIDPRRSIRTAIRRAGLIDFRPHDCRHCFASELLAQGMSLGEISHLLGHRDIAKTRRYSHLMESRSIEAVSKMTEEIFKEVKNG